MSRLVGSCMKDGLLLIDKPAGPTSHDIVQRVRRRWGTRQVGHAGTLDPAATGLLVVLLGQGTRLVPYFTGHDKVYEADICFGTSTDTLDAAGRVTAEVEVSSALVRALSEGPMSPHWEPALDVERARSEQVPPAASAIHVDGERAHERLRRGEALVMAPRPVRVHELVVLSCNLHALTVTVRVHADKGYYVRALARDFADTLGTVGHITRLRRVRSGPFDVARACPPDDAGLTLIPVADAVREALPWIILDARHASDARAGRAVTAGEALSQRGPCAWFDEHGHVIAIGEARGDRAFVLRGFPVPTSSSAAT
jgi:tRNA pseudouridine55 synthase